MEVDLMQWGLKGEEMPYPLVAITTDTDQIVDLNGNPVPHDDMPPRFRDEDEARNVLEHYGITVREVRSPQGSI